MDYITEEDVNRAEKRMALVVGILAAMGFVMGAIFGWVACDSYRYSQRQDTVWVDKVTTRYAPAPTKDTITRYETVTLPYLCHTKADTITIHTHDSVKVPIPLGQRTYEDSLYTAYISGYRIGDYPRLDSITVRQRTAYITRTIAQKRKPWSVGVGVGYGLAGKTFSPYIGIGLQYKILEF